jgi:hypothetical protein
MERLTHKTDEEQRAFCARKGIDPSQHCLDMAWFISDPVEHESQGANPVISWIPNWDEYRIHISRRGNRAVPIRFCPWCGARLPESKAELWFKKPNALGYDDPTEQDIPEEYTSDKWWRGK